LIALRERVSVSLSRYCHGARPLTRDADREELIAAATDLLARRVHDVGAAARFDWTRRVNRGGSVCRSIEAVIEGLEILPPGPNLDPTQARQATSNPGGDPPASYRRERDHRLTSAGVVQRKAFQPIKLV
jgi:hypothetical protein